MRLLIEFDGFSEEQRIVGQMLMAYGEFEFVLASIVGYSIGDEHAGARIFFRVHGESARLDVADAILRPYFEKLGLNGQWGNALGASRYCKDIRNQYAHSNWLTPKNDVLTFVNMDSDVASPDGPLMLQLYPTDLSLLKKQREYFEYTNDWLYFLQCRCRRKSGLESPDPATPKSIPQPPKHNRPKKPPAPPKV